MEERLADEHPGAGRGERLGQQAGPYAVGVERHRLTTLALQTSTTAHSAVVIGVLPLATAACSAALTGRRPSATFWTAAGTGALAVLAFTLSQSRGLPGTGDLSLFGALLLCAAGYAQGGRLAGHMPGWQVIAWGCVAALLVTVLVAALALPREPVRART